MRRLLPLLLLLAACGREPPPAPPPSASFRDASAPIASTTRGGPADLAGEWVVAEAFPGGPFGLSRGGTARLAMDASGTGTWTLTGADGTARALPVTSPAPGRYRAAGLGGETWADLWVLWVDDDFRTAAVGTPDGAFGWVMDRPGAASPDRARAAREMLDFNGYDLGRLR